MGFQSTYVKNGTLNPQGANSLTTTNSLTTSNNSNRRFKRSLLAMCIMTLGAPVWAQNQPDAKDDNSPVEEVVVTGQRANLESAQEIKRNASTFVDSLSANDIGSLPDRSVLEAMAHIPGVAVERFAASNDPDHFGVEGSGVAIRGMSATRSEFNGRDSFTANSGRGLSFQDVSPEMVAGVDVYKNQTADMIEGGIAGTVSLRTRKPFDASGRVISVSADYSYGDMAEEWTPTYSGLYSDRWMTPAGEFGLLLNYANSSLRGESNGIQADALEPILASSIPGAEAFVGDGTGTVWLPNGSNLTQKNDDRDRTGYGLAVQWDAPDESLQATYQFLRSDAHLSWTEHAFQYQGGYGKNFTQPLAGTEFDFTSDGVFQSGTITNGDGWRTADGNLERVPRAWGANGTTQPYDVAQWGFPFQANTRVNDQHTLVDDHAINLKWTPSDNFELSADFQYVKAETRNTDVTVMLGVYAIQDFDVSGSLPSLRLIEPWNGLRDQHPEAFANANFPGFTGDAAGDSNYFQDPTSYLWQSAMDHYEVSDGDSNAERLDATYHFDDAGWLTAVKVGLRRADREQTVRYTPYSWGELGPSWGSPVLWADTVPDQGLDRINFGDVHRGEVLDLPGDYLLFPAASLVRQVAYDGLALAESGNGWVPAANQPDASIATYFSPADVFITEEKNQAAYVRLDFGSDDYTHRFSGNLGLRYFQLERIARGAVRYPDLQQKNPVPNGAPGINASKAEIDTWAQQQVDAGAYPDLATAEAWVNDPNNYLSASELGFGNNAFEVQESHSTYHKLLPSFNLKVGITDDLISRFAISEAVALPDMGDVKNNTSISAKSINVDQPEIDPNNPDSSKITGAQVSSWIGDGGNPYLRPMLSKQVDLALEWYFAKGGSLSGTLFYKDLSDFFVSGSFDREFTNPVSGVTQTARVAGTVNNGTGKMQGFELAYQQFYDMLPAPWDGLGMGLTWAHIDSKSVPNAGPSTSNGVYKPTVDLSGLPLQGQSKDTADLTLMYEKDAISLRLSYNWRSRYLLTTSDVISGYPLWNEANGVLNGSAFYNITDQVKVGLELNNLLDSQTKTTMILDNEGHTAGRSWFDNDRRVALVVRANF